MATQDDDNDARVVVYPTRGKMVLLALGCCAFVLLLWWLPTIEPDNAFQRMKIWLAVGVGTPFFVFGFCYALRQLIRPRPALVADREGLWLWGTALGPGLLRWEEIDDVELCDFHKGHISLVVRLTDERAVLGRLNWGARMLAMANRALTGYPFHVPESGLPMSAEALRTRVLEIRARFAPAAGDQNGSGLPSK